jgi:hypothetical protein
MFLGRGKNLKKKSSAIFMHLGDPIIGDYRTVMTGLE